ncbi:hypothetical protein [Xanthomonas sp. MUS 060]|uniref:hypothetical protein n=1 Tax=Xanthomonas sp. MUS 060 TaxID=1588031 RepID=UPI0013791BD7|nr:hypothetical protein [Xanthomonas sp. MUS 060]
MTSPFDFEQASISHALAILRHEADAATVRPVHWVFEAMAGGGHGMAHDQPTA